MDANSQAKQNEFAAHFYEEINNAMGGTNPNEKLCLLLPGIALTKSDFEYDYKNNAPKGPVVEANESRLANKLYDPMDMVGGDNGKTLEHQYRSALDMLTPKVNPIIAEAKNELRKLLMKPFPYKFAPKNILKAEILKTPETGEPYFENAPADKEETVSDETKTYTFQEVFFRLYNEYVEQLGEWAKQRQRRKDYYERIAKANLELTTESEKNKKAENDYLQWYEDNGETWLTAVNQKMSVLLSIFSATDMKIVEGILDCGSGAELQEARQTLNNTRKINPDGGYIYPVKFNPTNWFEYLDTSFTPVDLLNTPTAILDELKLLYNRRDYINSRMIDIAAEVSANDSKIDEYKKAVDEARAKYIKDDDALQNAMEDTFGDFAKFVTKAICSACCPATGAVPTGGTPEATPITDKITEAVSTAAGQKQAEADSKVKGIIDIISDTAKEFESLTIPDNIQNGLSNITKILDTTKGEDGKTGRDKAIASLQSITLEDIKALINNISTAITNIKNDTSTSADDKKEKTEQLEEAKSSVTELAKAAEDAKATTSKEETSQKLNNIVSTDTQNPTALDKALTQAKSDFNLGDSITKGIDIIFEGSKKVNAAQSQYTESIRVYTESLANLQSAQNLQNFKLQLSNLKIDKNAVDSKIKLLEAKLSQVKDFDQCFTDSTTPPSVPEGFTQLNIVHTVSETNSSSYERTTSITSSKTKGFWCFKTKKRTTKTTSHIEKLCTTTGSEIEIGMNVAKVGIEREWFNPGIFALTGEMYNVAEKTDKEVAAELEEAKKKDSTTTIEKIDPVLRISHGIGDGTADDMEKLSHDVFPCYPTSMIVARDVTIKITTTLSSDSSSMYSATKDASSSKAFFVYNAGNGSHSHTSSGKANSKSNNRAITMRFTTPQIIGYFLQIVPEDKSALYPPRETKNDENDIVAFVQAYEKVIKERLNSENAGSEVINEDGEV